MKWGKHRYPVGLRKRAMFFSGRSEGERGKEGLREVEKGRRKREGKGVKGGGESEREKRVKMREDVGRTKARGKEG